MSKPTRSITTLPRSLLTQSKAGPSRLPPSRSRLTRPLHSTSSSSKPATSSSKPVFSSINSTEISHFSRLSSQWWDPTGEFSLLHRMNPTRIEYIGQKVALDSRDEEEWTFAGRHGDRAREEGKGVGRWLEGRRCLDVGCGGGLLSEVRILLMVRVGLIWGRAWRGWEGTWSVRTPRNRISRSRISMRQGTHSSLIPHHYLRYQRLHRGPHCRPHHLNVRQQEEARLNIGIPRQRR